MAVRTIANEERVQVNAAQPAEQIAQLQQENARLQGQVQLMSDRLQKLEPLFDAAVAQEVAVRVQQVRAELQQRYDNEMAASRQQIQNLTAAVVVLQQNMQALQAQQHNTWTEVGAYVEVVTTPIAEYVLYPVGNFFFSILKCLRGQ